MKKNVLSLSIEYLYQCACLRYDLNDCVPSISFHFFPSSHSLSVLSPLRLFSRPPPLLFIILLIFFSPHLLPLSSSSYSSSSSSLPLFLLLPFISSSFSSTLYPSHPQPTPLTPSHILPFLSLY